MSWDNLIAEFIKHKRRTMTAHQQQVELVRKPVRALQEERFIDLTHISEENARWDLHSSGHHIQRLQRLNEKRSKETAA